MISRLNHALDGTPDTVLTVGLVGIGLFAFWLALAAPPAFKAAALAWFVFP